MKIVVCIRQGLDGELGPFDASAYEAALSVENAEVTLLTMASAASLDFLRGLTRLGAGRAILLSDKAFAGADTLATAYALSRAIRRLSPDYVFCGRQTLIGDTAQTPPMLAEMLGFDFITEAMTVRSTLGEGLVCTSRRGERCAAPGTLIALERSYTLRLPRLRSKTAEPEIWSAADVTADPQKCGLVGSPTRVLASFENQSGKRKCTFVRREELADVISRALTAQRQKAAPTDEMSRERLGKVLSVGEAPRGFAEAVSDNVIEVAPTDADTLAGCILAQDSDAVIWGSDARSKELAARVAARLSLGLCADCTHLAVEEGALAMYRPALSGSVIAKIKSLTRPSMATVRTEKGDVGDVIVAAGFGVREQLDRVKEFADSLGATLCASRKLVDGGFAPYERQVGLTGSRVAPPVYVAVGISGAVHHIVGMERSGVVIAINPDKNAPIFEYADYGIVDTF